jgi:membrane protein insertase Oxa1/YidC/SpoIIIJ
MGLILYWMTTNLWTVGQGLITRRLVPKPNPTSPAAPTGPKRSSRTPPKEENAAVAETPKQAPAPPQTRRVKKKKGGARH